MIVNLFGMHDRSLCPVFNRSCAGGSIVLPQGSAAFRAIVACYPFCPEEAPALASDVQIFIRDADDWAWHRTAPPLWKNTARTRRIRLSWLYSGAGHSFDANQPDRLYFGNAIERQTSQFC